MSMDLFVFLALQSAPTATEWQDAVESQGFPIQISQDVDLSKHSGFLPIELHGTDSGLYFLLDDHSDLVSHFPKLAASDLEKGAVYSLQWGGSFAECACVFYSASALVSKFGGRAFDPQTRDFLDATKLTKTGKECDEWRGKE